ncbi:MAG TPA: PP2C family protein-serine/threonine phosphatase [Terriglobales bacterium]
MKTLRLTGNGPTLRSHLQRWNLLPLSPLARFFWIAFAVACGCTVLGAITHGLISGLLTAVAVITWIFAVPTGIWVAFRWTKQIALWRLRNRLIITYAFIGGAPILLLTTLGLIAAYLLSGQFATFVATADLNSELERISVENQAVLTHLKSELGRANIDLSKVPEAKAVDASDRRVVALFDNNRRPVSLVASSHMDEFDRPAWLSSEFKGIVRQRGHLYFRAAASFTMEGRQYTLVSSEPLDSAAVSKLLQPLGLVQIFGTAVAENQNGDLIDVQTEDSSKLSEQDRARAELERRLDQEDADNAETVRAGTVPSQRSRLDRALFFTSPLQTTEWRTGRHKLQGLVVETRPSVLFDRLFSANAIWGSKVRGALFAIAVFFGFIEILALFVGMRLTRSITQAVYELYNATQHIERGDLTHRIRIRSNDQLAALEGSFNNMSASLGRLLQEQREKERLQSELAIAQEVQAQLFPRAWTTSRYLDLFGICKPARTVSGDYYDFLSLGDSRTGLAMGDISGKGISAALLMATIQSAVRSFELGKQESRLLAAAGGANSVSSTALEVAEAPSQSPGEVMWLLNRHLYQSTPPEKYATMFLAVYDGETRELSYANAGHLPPIVIRANGGVERLSITGTVIGLFESMAWEEKTVQLAPGDLVVAFSDGVTEPENEFGEYGEDRLIALVRENRHRALEEIARLTVEAVQQWIGTNEQPDDVTVVLARATA